MIKNNDYKAGDRLPSLSELSEMFEVGKPTVREALSVLAATGVLEIRHGSGIFLREPITVPFHNVAAQLQVEKVEGENLIHWLEYRRAVESEAARLAAKRRNELDLQAIAEAKSGYEEDHLQGKTNSEWDYHFHQRIALATHNPVFSQAVTPSFEAFKNYFALSLKQSLAIPTRREMAAKEHQLIFEAIKKGDALAAQNAMIKHIDNTVKKVKLLCDI
ncbi:MAG TPA: FadR family transcriptional regulator [Peptococcaceae bacterium]|nr:FadR family transcriptional regulator [Peptococcaceae bacterium]